MEREDEESRKGREERKKEERGEKSRSKDLLVLQLFSPFLWSESSYGPQDEIQNSDSGATFPGGRKEWGGYQRREVGMG